jgi:ATP-dependent helicase/nuclease subunit B
LNVLRQWPNPSQTFGVARIIPAGVFYVSLRGNYQRGANRIEALDDPEKARKLAYKHTGRFDTRALALLDSRPDTSAGDQFNYRLTASGNLHGNSREALGTVEFLTLLDSIERHLKEMGAQIFAGAAEVSPYRKGSATACQYCEYQAICRIDPWTQRYRVLRREAQS